MNTHALHTTTDDGSDKIKYYKECHQRPPFESSSELLSVPCSVALHRGPYGCAHSLSYRGTYGCVCTHTVSVLGTECCSPNLFLDMFCPELYCFFFKLTAIFHLKMFLKLCWRLLGKNPAGASLLSRLKRHKELIQFPTQ